MAADVDQLGKMSDQHMLQLTGLVASLVKMIAALWGDFSPARDAEKVTAIAARSATLIMQATSQTRLLNRAYQTQVLKAMGTKMPTLPKLVNTYPRANTNPLEVYARPAQTFIWELSQGNTVEEAKQAASDRLETLVDTDLMLADRDEQDRVYRAVPAIIGYRRVVHPELAVKSHMSCGLCIVASQNFYRSGELKPLHGDCHCDTLPITGTGEYARQDPGLELNKDDLKTIYAAAGSTYAADLKNVRIAVTEHGELGPMLIKAGDHFRTPEEAGRKPYVKQTPQTVLSQHLAAIDDASSKLATAQHALADLNEQLKGQTLDYDRLTTEQSQLVDQRTTLTQQSKYLSDYLAALNAALGQIKADAGAAA